MYIYQLKPKRICRKLKIIQCLCLFYHDVCFLVKIDFKKISHFQTSEMNLNI